MSLCMCIGLIQYLYAQEFPSTYEMYDIYISSDLYRISRDYVHHDKVVFRAPYYNKIAEIPCNEGYGEVAETYTSSKQLYVVFDGQEYPLEPNGHVTIEADAGFYNVDFKYEFISAECETSLQTSHSIQVKQHPEGFTYLQPDDVWEIELPELYEPPVVNPYPANSSWAKYNEPSQGKAIATIKLGDGNSELTRPLIFVDGVDFAETVVIDPNIGKPVRYGSTGWENVSQGLLSGVVENFEDELFKDYPKALTALRNDQTQYGEANYDIILVEFLDGADYIQKCAKLLQEVIKKVNEEKVCGYDNVLLGLSMGGQVSRFALSYFEAAGIDHGCREYVSFDSPHINANIPLAVQAFVYAGAKFQNSEAAQQSWHALNRPAAAQMLKYNLMAELEKGTIEYNHTVENFSFLQFDLVVTESSLPFAESFPKIAQLRAQFYNERSELSLPKMTYNVAIANGSAFGQSQPGDICLAAVHNEADQSLVLPPVPLISLSLAEAISAYLTDKYEDDLLRVELNAAGSVAENIFVFNYINQDDYSFNKIHISNSPQLEELDLAPGCMRNDIKGIKEELELLVVDNPVDNPLGGGWFSEIFVDFDLSLSCGLENTTFMNTASTLGIKTDDYLMDLNDALKEDLIRSPFDAIFYPALDQDNEPHVEVNDDNRSFLLQKVNENIMRFPSDLSLPTDEHGSKYNFAHQFHRLNSITLNKNGVLAINDIGFTGFIDVDPQSHANSEFHDVVSSSSTCSETTVTINNGGRVSLGAATNHFRSGNLLLSAGSDMVVNNGGQLFVENKSQLRIAENSQLLLNPGSNFRINGEESELKLDGKLVTTGDVTIQVNGKIIIEENGILELGSNLQTEMSEESRIELKGLLHTTGDVTIDMGGTFVIHPSAMFELGGKLTINGQDISSDLLSIAGHHVIDQSLDINNGTITMVADAQIEVVSSPSGSQNTVNLQSVILEQEGMHSAFGSRFKFRNLESITIDDFVAKDMPNSIVVDMQQVSSIELSNLNFTNCYKPIQAKNIHQLTLEESQFTSIPVSSTGGNYEGFNGVALSNINTVQLLNCSFNGFGENIGNTDYLYALELIDCPQVDIADSEFTNNKTGINVPQDSDQQNITNLFITNSLFQNNYAGIEMYGFASDAVNIKSSGYLNMECVRMLDNYYGVDGEDILLQADFYFADEQSTANTFRPKNKNEGGGSPVTFHINYTTFSYSDIYLRGNIWYDFDGAEAIVNADGTAANVIKSPGIDGNTGPVELQCASIALDDDCKGCFQQEDDDDCTLKIAEENTNIASIYRDANSAVRNRDFALVEAIFEPLSTIANDSSISGLASKCDYQTHIARVFALPRENDTNWEIGGRSKAEVEYAVVPNPSSESIMLEGLPTTDIMIVSSAGQILMHFEYQEGSTVDISNLPSGLYTIVSANTKSTQRFIVMK